MDEGYQCDGYGTELLNHTPGSHVRDQMRRTSSERKHSMSTQATALKAYCQDAARLIPVVPKAKICRSPTSFTGFGSGSQLSDVEMHSVSLFRYRTGKQFAAYFDSTLWQDYSNYLVLTHPVVFACAAALGAVHRRYLLGISREAFEYCAHADKLYRRAVSLLKHFQAEVCGEGSNDCSNSDRDILMCSHCLLGLFNGFQGDLDDCVLHMTAGMKCLLDRPMVLLRKESQRVAAVQVGDMYADVISQIHGNVAEVFGSTHNILGRYSHGARLPDMPLEFTSLEQARDLLFTELDWIMSTPGRVWSVPNKYRDAQNMHVSRLLEWTVAYGNTVEKMDRTHRERVACMLLKQTRHATFLLLSLTRYVYAGQNVRDFVENKGASCEIFDWGLWPDATNSLFEIQGWCNQYGYSLRPDVSNELDVDLRESNLWSVVAQRQDLLMKLKCVRVLCERRFKVDSTVNYLEYPVAFDSGISPPLSPVAESDLSAKLRHVVQSTLRKSNTSVDDDWGWLSVYGVAEKLSAIEEHAVVAVARSKLPPGINPTWIDFGYFAESRRLLLNYCHSDGIGMRWTQEWWAF